MIRKEATDLGLTQAVLDRGIVSEGNRTRVANVIKRAMRGEPVTIGVIGGSITEGTAASSRDKRYAEILRAWWKSTFPDSALSFVNAGKGATDSLMGVHRAQADLLSKKPDLVIAEFSVNDKAEERYTEAYEGLVRRLLKQSNQPAVILLFMMKQDGSSTQALDQQVGERYDLPMISYRDALWPENGEKLYAWSQLSPDNVHPNDTGHAIVGELLIYYLNTVRAQLNAIPTAVEPLPAPLTANGYENAVLLTNMAIQAASLGSFELDYQAFSQFPLGWTVKGGREPLVFELEDTKNIHLLYKYTTSGKGGRVSVKLDGREVARINADFAGGWGDCAMTAEVLTGSTAGSHTLEIELISSSPKDEFSLLGILKS